MVSEHRQLLYRYYSLFHFPASTCHFCNEPMTGDTSWLVHLGSIGLLVLLEGLLSGDNALVLALLVRHLPKPQRQKALVLGLAGAAFFRLVALLVAKSIIQFWYLQALGALYLFYLPAKHFLRRKKPKGLPEVLPAVSLPRASSLSFWKTVALVEFTDIAFAIDSVLVAVTVSKELWVVYTGVILGVILLRFGAGALVVLLEKRPGLEHMASLLVGWVAIKLGMMSAHNFTLTFDLAWKSPEMPIGLFWAVTGIVVVLGSIVAEREHRRQKSMPPTTTKE